jgi:hypothetical protein
MAHARDRKTLGFKPLSTENWRDADSTFALFHPWGSSDDPGTAWAAEVLDTELPSGTPIEIIRMFEAAVGALVYATYFYPLLALGVALLLRIPEAAASAKCKELAAPPGIDNFARAIDWLASEGWLQPNDRERWHLLRQLRNETAHPSFQDIWPPGESLHFRDIVVEAVRTLFPEGRGVAIP